MRRGRAFLFAIAHNAALEGTGRRHIPEFYAVTHFCMFLVALNFRTAPEGVGGSPGLRVDFVFSRQGVVCYGDAVYAYN